MLISNDWTACGNTWLPRALHPNYTNELFFTFNFNIERTNRTPRRKGVLYMLCCVCVKACTQISHLYVHILWNSMQLPRSLRLQVANANYRDTVDRCCSVERPFSGCTPRFLNALVVMLRVLHVIPGDTVVFKDEAPRELYFVYLGALHVVPDFSPFLYQCRSSQIYLSTFEVNFELISGILHSVR
jgi:hypothetical protein